MSSGFRFGQLTEAERNKAAQNSKKGQKLSNDWTCPKCQASVFASKPNCFRCQTPKPSNAHLGPAGGTGSSTISPDEKQSVAPKRKKRPKFTAQEHLHKEKGLDLVLQRFPKRLRRAMGRKKCNEASKLSTVIQTYMEWAKHMYQHDSFATLVRKIELEGHRCKAIVHRMREDEIAGKTNKAAGGSEQESPEPGPGDSKGGKTSIAQEPETAPVQVVTAPVQVVTAPEVEVDEEELEDMDFMADMGDEYDMME